MNTLIYLGKKKKPPIVRFMKFLSIIFFFLFACSSSPLPLSENWQNIEGRDNGDGNRKAIYQVQVPQDWQRIDSTGSIVDSRIPLCTYIIDTPEGQIDIHIHNFPYEIEQPRIPPQAQVQRWKEQLKDGKTESFIEFPYGHGGFAGICFSGVGLINNVERQVVAFAMQLDYLHYMKLKQKKDNSSYYHQMAADYTIKISGTPEAVKRYEEEIFCFARSFELIDEI